MTPQHDKLFETPDKGAEKLTEYKDRWTEALGSRSVEACYAVIAGVWAVHGEAAGILVNT